MENLEGKIMLRDLIPLGIGTTLYLDRNEISSEQIEGNLPLKVLGLIVYNAVATTAIGLGPFAYWLSNQP